ncbi:MAG: hypothetical protein KJI72_01010 [Patescibacteria group bacterium]|nr:hypothetical protein [Patescibacteria group bacterium]
MENQIKILREDSASSTLQQNSVQVCRSCEQKFTIKPDDFAFYEKISVPPPTLCPDCRQQRRYAWRNERVLYRRRCDLCGKSTVTIYSLNKPFKVYCPPCWWSDKWDALEYGRDFDFSRPFFGQWQELQLQVPRIALLTKNSVNSEYTNHAWDNKNCYLCFGCGWSENVMYSTNIFPARDCIDCYRIEKESNELLYECINSYKCYQSQYGFLLEGCTNCYYCYDCRGCSNCFLSYNLRNKQYHILNKPYTKEEYQKKIEEFNLSSYESRVKLYEKWLAIIRDNVLHRAAVILQSANATGNMIFNSKNIHHSFDASGIEDAKYLIVAIDSKECMDSYHFGFNCELIYECHALIRDYNVLFTNLSYDDSHIMYCDSCHNSENLFGCVGVKQGKYSIFNKRYNEEEYKELKRKIIAHMSETGEFGEFFPAKISPFGYNETQGQIYMPLSKEEVMKRGWRWEDQVPGTFGKETVKPNDIPDKIEDVEDSIVNEVLMCVKCKRNYNIIRSEFDLYRREKIPIPRLCPHCRYLNKIALRPPRKLWHRQCVCDPSTGSGQATRYENTTEHFHGKSRCPNEFETSYAPERKEIVYCEQCYNAEVV